MFILSKLLEDNADILAAFLSKTYCALFCMIYFIFSVKNFNLISYCHFYKKSNNFFLNFKGLLAGNVVSIDKKLKVSFVHSLQISIKYL